MSVSSLYICLSVVCLSVSCLCVCLSVVHLSCRLAAIDGDDGYTGVKPQHCYITCPPWRPHRCFDFFYSNTNNFVQLEDTTIKTERCCSAAHRTNDSRASQQSRSALLRLSRPDFLRCGINFLNTMR